MIYIYALRCPETGQTRYVGKTKNTLAKRLHTHVLKAKSGQTSHHCARWILLLLGKGLMPEIVALHELPDGSDWQSAEAAAIRSYRAAGHDLTNLTGGGDGFHDVRPEVLKRRGQSRSRTLKDPAKRAEFNQRMTASRHTEQAKRNRSSAIKALWQDPIMKQRMLDGMRTPEAIARRSEASRRRMNDPVIAARHVAKMKDLFKSPEAREKIRRAGAKRWAGHRERQRGT